jgi:hypothetical protein
VYCLNLRNVHSNGIAKKKKKKSCQMLTSVWWMRPLRKDKYHFLWSMFALVSVVSSYGLHQCIASPRKQEILKSFCNEIFYKWKERRKRRRNYFILGMKVSSVYRNTNALFLLISIFFQQFHICFVCNCLGLESAEKWYQWFVRNKY